LEHEAAYWTCVSAVEKREGWELYHHAGLAGRLYPNHAGHFRAPEGAGALIAREIITFYQALGSPPAAFVDALATPRDLVPCLLAAGFHEWSGADSDLLLYVGPDLGPPSSPPVERVQTPQDTAAWADLMEPTVEPHTRATLQQLYRTEIGDPRVTPYLVRVAGQPAARCELFACQRLGRVEAVFTLPAFRGRGLASALIRRAVSDSLAQGHHLTYIFTEPGSDAQRLYERLGFRTVAPHLIRGFVYGL